MTATINTVSVAIQTVSPNLQIGEIQLSADKRNTKDTKLTDSERIRRIVLPANSWGELNATMNGERNQSLTDILKASLVKLGSDRLRDMLEETPMLRQVEVAAFNVSSLLAWSEETASSRGSITFTRAQAEEWFAKSVTAESLVNKWRAAETAEPQIKARLAFVANRFGALAAKNHGIAKAEDADKLITMIDPTESSSIVTEIMGRLEHISKTLQAKANEATVSMDDL